MNAKEEAAQIMNWLTELFDDQLPDVIKKIHMVMSDNSNSANLTRQTLIDIFNKEDPSQTREKGRCSGEFSKINQYCSLSNLHYFNFQVMKLH